MILKEKFISKLQNRKLEHIKRMINSQHIPDLVQTSSDVENGKYNLVLYKVLPITVMTVAKHFFEIIIIVIKTLLVFKYLSLFNGLSLFFYLQKTTYILSAKFYFNLKSKIVNVYDKTFVNEIYILQDIEQRHMKKKKFGCMEMIANRYRRDPVQTIVILLLMIFLLYFRFEIFIAILFLASNYS